MADTPDVAAVAVAVAAADAAGEAAAPRRRPRPRPGERRIQILQALAAMLEAPGGERITTAALAARIGLSEAALYRHFASKAQMFEGLIDFIEASVFTLVDPIAEGEPPGPAQAGRSVGALLQFGEKNPGMTRVVVGDALVFEHERLAARMNRFFERVELQLRRSLGDAAGAEGAEGAEGAVKPGIDTDAAARASVLTAFCIGRLQRHTRSGFRRLPTEQLDAALRLLGAAPPGTAPT